MRLAGYDRPQVNVAVQTNVNLDLSVCPKTY
jgi:hypothetical protein